MGTKIIHVTDAQSRTSVTLMGDAKAMERIIAVLDRKFESIHVKLKKST